MAEEKNISTNQLATIINKGFNTVAKQISGLEDKTSNVETKISSLEKDVKAIRQQLTGVIMRNEFDKLESRVDYLENIMAVKKN